MNDSKKSEQTNVRQNPTSIAQPLTCFSLDELFIVCWPYGEAEQAAIKKNPLVKESLRNSVVTATAISSLVCALTILVIGGALSYWPLIVAGFLCTTFVGSFARDSSTPAYIRLTRNSIFFEYAASDAVDCIDWSAIKEIKLQVIPAFEGFSANDKIIIRHEVQTRNGKQIMALLIKASAIRTRENWRQIEQYMERLGLMDLIFVDPKIAQALRPDERTPSYTELWLEALTAPPEREKLGPLPNGHQLQNGRLSVVRALGAGGQGRTYLAVCQKSSGAQSLDSVQSTVALKEYILPVYVDGKARQQALAEFNREAQLMMSSQSEHIVGIHEYFVEDQRGYLVLEYIQGEDLRKLIKRNGPLPPQKVVDLTIQMCDMLAHLHGLTPPIVHRDFTPENLILDNSGRLKLIDFTAAQVERTEPDGDSEVVGKREYIPPEQFKGKANRLSDIYSLGCTVYFLLTGRDPEALSQSDTGTGATEAARKLSGIVARATAQDQTKRYRSAEELRSDLQDCITSGQNACQNSA